MNEHPSFLFVCLGNICRSPLAEAALRAEADKHRLDLTIDSAGTGFWHVGNPPDPRARAEAHRHGIDIADYKARQVCADDFYKFTYILALDAENLAHLASIAPDEGTAQFGLLMETVAPGEARSVSDPYHGDASDFAQTWREVSQAAQAIAERLVAGAVPV